MRFWRRFRSSEQGETLVETLVALSILGIAGVAILAGLQLSLRFSDINRKEATGGAYVRSVSEAIQSYVAQSSLNYKGCAGPNYYTGKAGLTLPSGYTASELAAQTWNGTSWGSCSTDTGVQRVQVSVTSPPDSQGHTDVETLYVVLRNPCNGTTAGAPCSS